MKRIFSKKTVLLLFLVGTVLVIRFKFREHEVVSFAEGYFEGSVLTRDVILKEDHTFKVIKGGFLSLERHNGIWQEEKNTLNLYCVGADTVLSAKYTRRSALAYEYHLSWVDTNSIFNDRLLERTTLFLHPDRRGSLD